MCFGVPLTISKRDSAPKTSVLIKDLSHLYCDAHLIVTDYKKGQGFVASLQSIMEEHGLSRLI